MNNNIKLIPPQFHIQNKPVFFQLFFDILFRPNNLAKFIHSNISFYKQELLVFSFTILLLSLISKSATHSNFSSAFFELGIWLISLFILYFISWIFARQQNISIPKLFIFFSLAQAPLIFYSISFLFLEQGIMSFQLIIYLWNICLWVWALFHVFNLGILRSVVLVVTLLLLPIILISIFLFLTVGLIINFIF